MEGGGAYCSGDHDMGNLKATELRLGLPGSEMAPRKTKRALPEPDEESQSYKRSSTSSDQDVISAESGRRETEPVAKAQVVGWPPVRSYRKNSFKAMKEGESTGGVLYVKVSMDGAPYLRKIDLKVYKGYKELREALEDKFKCFSLGEVSSGMEEFEYAITYEDKDGDWMLAGDVPWEMFICSCKRLRIMKGSEARGLSSTT